MKCYSHNIFDIIYAYMCNQDFNLIKKSKFWMPGWVSRYSMGLLISRS